MDSEGFASFEVSFSDRLIYSTDFKSCISLLVLFILALG